MLSSSCIVIFFKITCYIIIYVYDSTVNCCVYNTINIINRIHFQEDFTLDYIEVNK